ncbi:MAG: acetyl-CoA carboxylase biotin carboxyl carrier protein [Phycisphaerae bacterium]|nr:acetyl-CoA carboxylase biotin carboxyl carrier protein [Phycisphaerae bacterium]
MVDYRKLRELVKLMVENDLSELELRDQQEAVVLKRGAPPGAMAMMPTPIVHQVSSAPASAPAASGGDDGADDESDLVAIKSPMVGTFYAAPDPNSPAYVSVGSSVGAETVVCIVEAMKVFSEIKAECSGKIEKILVKSGEPVEFGQRLFLVRPS